MSLKLLSIYHGFISRLRGNAADDRICPVLQLQTKLPGTLGAERIARVNDASLVHLERRKDNTKAWIGRGRKESWSKTLSRPRFLDFHQ